MSFDRRVPVRSVHRNFVLAIPLALALTGLGGADAAVRTNGASSDAPALDMPDLVGPIERLLTSLANALNGTSSSIASISPVIVSGEATCPQSTEDHILDCAAAAQVVCARSGFKTSLELDTTTRWICRGTTLAAVGGAGSPGCRVKTSVDRALCW